MFPNKIKSKKLTKSKPIGKKVVILTALVIAVIGAYFLFFAKAATNNCQPENGVQICDVDQVGATNDTVLSMNGEAESLASQGWGTYYGAAFRAPTSAYNGAVPVHRVFNGSATWHDWVTDDQKNAKQAKYGAANYEGVAFFAWTGPGQPGTVPVYRLARGGAESNTVWSTDRAWVDKMLALDANNPNGWKLDNLMPGIAFYAYPPNYTVAGLVNPYDCSILENFTSERCTKQATNLGQGIASGAIPADASACPKTVNEYINNPMSNLYPKDCQDFWNKYMNDCSITENFTSDRCKEQREALAREQQRQIELRKRQEEVARKKRTTTPGPKTTTPSDPGSTTPTEPTTPKGPCEPGWILRGGECRKSPAPTTPSGQCEAYGGKVINGVCKTCPDGSTISSSGECSKTYTGLKCSISYGLEQKWKPWDASKSVTYSTSAAYSKTDAITWCRNKKNTWLRSLGTVDGTYGMKGTDCSVLETKICKVKYKKATVYNYAYSWDVK